MVILSMTTDWTLFNNQESMIDSINKELFSLRKSKYPEYLDSYYKFYKEFGMRGMVGDLYRKFDRLKNMSQSFSDKDIREKEKEIKDQYYDLISYMQLQLYFLEKESWRKEPLAAPNSTNYSMPDQFNTIPTGGFVKDGKIFKVDTQNVYPAENGYIFVSCKNPDSDDPDFDDKVIEAVFRSLWG